MLILRILAVWILFIPLAIINGAVRENLLLPLTGKTLALPLSGVLLSCLIFLTTYMLYPLLKATPGQSWAIGSTWLFLTVSFEFCFWHFIMRKPWRELFQQYDLRTGNLWVVVLFVVLMSPWLASKIRSR